jgi:hypothetical protein
MVRFQDRGSGDRVSDTETVRDAFYAARKAVRDARRAFAQSGDSAFVQVMQGAISEYTRMRSEGVSREDAIRGLEAELRGAWPKSVSKFKPACDGCDDTGYRELVCWDGQRCGREVCARNPERQHPYVVACDCGAGDKMRKRSYAPDEALTQVGRSQKKPRGFSRFGQ